MNSLPFDIQENIYKRLGPHERIRMKLVLSKSIKIGKPKIDRKLAVVKNYVTKYKKSIKTKTKAISIEIINFIKNNQDDNYIKNLGIEIGIENEKSINIDLLLNDIRNNKINKNIEIYSNIQNQITHEYEYIILNTIYSSCNSETFQIIYQIPIINSIFNNDTPEKDNITSFIFGLVNYQNKNLLEHLSINIEYEKWFKIGKIYMQRPSIAKIFSNNVNQVNLLLNYFDLPVESIEAIINNAEEKLYEDTVILLLKYIKIN